MKTCEHDGWSVHRWVGGFLSSNIYLIRPSGSDEAALIDAGGAARAVLKHCSENQLSLKYIFLTHRHADHTAASRKISRKTGAKVMINRRDGSKLGKMSLSLDDKAKFPLGPLSIEVIHTPGHTPGGVTLLAPGAMFTGDTLFAGGVGRADLRGGNARKLMESLQKLMEYPEDTAVYPGHGPPSAVGREKEHNRHIRPA